MCAGVRCEACVCTSTCACTQVCICDPGQRPSLHWAVCRRDSQVPGGRAGLPAAAGQGGAGLAADPSSPRREARAPQAARLQRPVRRRDGVSRHGAHGVRVPAEQRRGHQPLPAHAGLAGYARGRVPSACRLRRPASPRPSRSASAPWPSARVAAVSALSLSEERAGEPGPESSAAQEAPSVPAAGAGESEPSDEDAAALSAESRDTADEDTPGPAARAPERELIFGAHRPATPQEPRPPEEGVDLLGLHSEAGPAPPLALGGPPSNADLLSCLLGATEAAPEGAPGDLLGGETPLLFTSPAPTTGGPPAAGT